MIPEKPQTTTFTDAQWEAIWHTGSDVLVAAAAGSGKTRVLITRLIEKVIAKKNPIDVDELLVVTFTNAAAAEMRQRMASALEEELQRQPNNERLRKQLTLLNKAHISTMHSFCLHVVKQYAYMLDIDPAFRIADTMEAALLREDVLSEVLEQLYSEEETVQLTYALVDSFSSDRSDIDIETLIEQLYNYAAVDPDPVGWLRTLPILYAIGEEVTIEQLPITSIVFDSLDATLQEVNMQYEAIRNLAEQPDGPNAFLKTVEADEKIVGAFAEALKRRDWQAMYESVTSVQFPRATSIKKDSCDPHLAEMVKQLRKEAKETIEALRNRYFVRPPARLVEEMRQMHPLIEHLAAVTERFYEAYQEAKRERAIVDFADLEHYAYAILTTEENGMCKPSEIAELYQEKFEEVLVDEYQDTNLLQEAIIQLVKRNSEGHGNLFMVGDVKQSIYRFRLAEPQLFLQKYARFTKESKDGHGTKIDLNANFRSRPEILQATNFIFSQLMGADVGEIVYDDDASLKYGARYEALHAPVNLHLITDSEEEQMIDILKEEMKPEHLEARAIIQQIEKLMREGAEVTDAFTDEKRPMEYRDIVILFRSMTWANTFAEEFKRANIPLYVELRDGYFDAIEVQVMMSILQVVDNSYQDIPLASTLRAPFFDFTNDELSDIRKTVRSDTFFEAVQQYTQEGHAKSEALLEKLNRFFYLLKRWKNIAQHGSVTELIAAILEDTYYYEYVGALPNGKQRQANIRALQNRARSYEQTSYRGLFRFLRFIERMRSRGEDLSVAKHVTDRDNVVRLMTIHASKGLEFPYVFVAGLGRTFNERDLREKYLFDQQYGIAVKAIDPKLRAIYTSLPFNALTEKKKLELRAEEMRILYVAMTRAKEHLHLVGSVKNFETATYSWQQVAQLSEEQLLPSYVRSNASNYLDWLGPALVRHEQFPLEERICTPLINDSQWQFTMWEAHTLLPREQEDRMAETSQEEAVEVPSDFNDWLNQEYVAVAATETPSKQSVTGLKRLTMLEQFDEEQLFRQQPSEEQKEWTYERPSFMQEERKLSGAEKGTAVHALMEHLNFQETYDAEKLQSFIAHLVHRQLLTTEEAQALNVDSLVKQLPVIQQKLSLARTIWNEVPFTYSYEVNGEATLLQGIIDCLYEDEQGELHIVDYKTDRVMYNRTWEEARAELMKRYTFQLQTYKSSVEQITKRPVAHCFIFSFDLNEWIKLV